MKKKLTQHTATQFEQAFGRVPEQLFLSPGRINLIGEHVDYNNGFVLPAAINKYVCFAIAKNGTRNGNFVALDLGETFQVNLDEPIVPTQTMWPNYLLGVLAQIIDRGLIVDGFDLAYSSTVPMGAGLSSSAAVECGFGYALNKTFSLGLSRQDIALMGQQAEHRFAGVNCGIMDQFASTFGKKNRVIQLDCDNLDYRYHPADFGDYALLLLDSRVKHTHLTSGYNDRRRETEQGLAQLRKQFPEVHTFREATIPQLDTLRESLGESVYQRCRFAMEEITRVLQAVEALGHRDYARLGALMTQTHHGLSQQYEVSCPELDFLVQTVLDQPQVLGARMMGGGFGGCAICLVHKTARNSVIAAATQAYKTAFGIDLKAYKIKISKGTTTYT